MRLLDNITLICVTSTNIEQSIRALKTSMAHIKFGSVKLISHEKPPNLPEDIVYESCHELLTFESNSYYMLYKLWNHVSTEFCITVQHDGYVINPDCWTNEFLLYDYIGAPWAIGNPDFIDPFGSIVRVGNGGFSLRSRKLLCVPQSIHIPPLLNNGIMYEDVHISVRHKHLYEKMGCKFAPIELAAKWSHETHLPEYSHIVPFGFHRYLPSRTLSGSIF